MTPPRDGGQIEILTRLIGVRRSGEGWTAQCPAHEDKQSSLSVHHRDGKWLLKCHAGCTRGPPANNKPNPGNSAPP